MIVAVTLGFLAVLAVGITHYAMMTRASVRIERLIATPDLRIVGLLVVIFAVHMFEAGLFALVFGLGVEMGLGGFAPESDQGAMDIFYFSLVNYTTLGLGDVYPSGHLRVIAALEAFVGFLMLSCSASMLFANVSEMQKRLRGE